MIQERRRVLEALNSDSDRGRYNTLGVPATVEHSAKQNKFRLMQ